MPISDLSISDDLFHFDEVDNPAKRVFRAAKKLGMTVNSICIEKPTLETGIDNEPDKGVPIIKGGAVFRGRVVEKLIDGFPKRNWEKFTECPYEDLKEPKISL